MRRLLLCLACWLALASPAVAQLNCVTQNGALTCAAPINLFDRPRAVSTPVLNTTQTWNAPSVTFTGWKSNITNNGSASSSLLLDLQVGGTSKFKVDLSGNVTAANGFGLGAAPYSIGGLYVNNAAGPGIHIKAGSASNTRSMMVFEQSNGAINSAVNATGAFYTNQFIVISGTFTAAQDATGALTSFTPGTTGLSDMLDVVGDTTYGIVSKASSVPGQLYTGLDHNGTQTYNVDETGLITSSAIAPTTGTDVTLVTTGSLTRSRYQVTITPASGGAGNCATQAAGFKAAALNADCVVATLPAGMRLVAAYADVTAGFTCSGTCSGTKVFRMGISAGGVEVFATSLNVAATGTFGLADADMGSGMTRAAQIQGAYTPSWSSTTTLTARFTSGTGNWGDGSSTFVNAGSIKFTLITEQAK